MKVSAASVFATSCKKLMLSQFPTSLTISRVKHTHTHIHTGNQNAYTCISVAEVWLCLEICGLERPERGAGKEERGSDGSGSPNLGTVWCGGRRQERS